MQFFFPKMCNLIESHKPWVHRIRIGELNRTPKNPSEAGLQQAATARCNFIPPVPMFSCVKQLKILNPGLRLAAYQLRYARNEAGQNRRRSKSPAFSAKKTDQKSQWWIVDGEMHEIGDHVPPRERFVIPRDNVPNRRRKQLREQFMRRTRLVLKESVSFQFSSLSLSHFVGCGVVFLLVYQISNFVIHSKVSLLLLIDVVE